MYSRVARVVLAFLLTATCVQAQTVTLRGTLHAVWDGHVAVSGAERVEHYLVDDAGRGYALDLRSIRPEEARRLAGQRVEITAGGVTLGGGAPARVANLRALVALAPPAITAAVLPRSFITLLCRFADDPVEPFQIGLVQNIMGGTYPGAIHFYGELSQDPLIMAGNAYAGWFSMPGTRSAYVNGTTTNHQTLAQDCVQAADATVDFSSFYGINLQFGGALSVRPTAPFDTLSFGGSWTLALDGPARHFGVTWMSRNHVQNYVVYMHEMGHALGWPHSSGRYGNEYDSRWDLMSAGYLRFEQPFGWLSIHTIAPHKDQAGWIPATRKWLPGTGVETAEIVRSALPPPTGYLMARIPITTRLSYTVEVRAHAGYDRPLPADAVLIHEVEDGRAYVVDPDSNGNPNDEGAIWRPGEAMVDLDRDLVIRVLGATANGFQVQIQRGSLPVAIGSDSVRRSGAAGVAYADTLVATGGLGTGRFNWAVSAGALPPGLSLGATTGQIAGIPTERGTFRFSVRASSGSFADERALRIAVHDPVRIAGDSLRRHALVGVTHVDSMRASGGLGSFRWSIASGQVPTGMSLDATTGIIAGLPADTGRFRFVLRAESDGLVDTKAVVLPVYRPLVIASGSTRRAAVMGATYADTVQVTGGAGSVSWALTDGALPPGITLDAALGILSGLPERTGAFAFTLRASDPVFSVLQAFSMSVTPPALTAAAIFDHLLASGPLAEAEARFLDLLGNRNGRVDVGDVRAWLIETGQLATTQTDPAAVITSLQRAAERQRGRLQK